MTSRGTKKRWLLNRPPKRLRIKRSPTSLQGFKSPRQKPVERRVVSLAGFERVDHDDRQVRIEFCQNLAAGAARRNAASAHNGDRGKLAVAGGDGCSDGDALRAIRQT